MTVTSSFAHSWITKTCSAFYNRERIFQRFCVKLAVVGIAPEDQNCRALTAGFGSAVQSNNFRTRK